MEPRNTTSETGLRVFWRYWLNASNYH
jgi:hypothetical protein